jgi:hypothetical protein
VEKSLGVRVPSLALIAKQTLNV